MPPNPALYAGAKDPNSSLQAYSESTFLAEPFFTTLRPKLLSTVLAYFLGDQFLRRKLQECSLSVSLTLTADTSTALQHS